MSEWLDEKRNRELERALGSPELSQEQAESLRRLDRHWARLQHSLATRGFYACQVVRLAAHLGKPFEEATQEDLEAYLDTMSAKASATLSAAKRFLRVFYKDLLTVPATASDDSLEAPVLTSYSAHAVHRIE